MTRHKTLEPDDAGTAVEERALRSIVGYQLTRANIAMLEVYHQAVGGPFDLRPVEFTLLAMLTESPGLPAKSLARALAVTAPNISMWIEKLEGRGLVERARSETDRRAQHIHATKEGARLVRESTQALLAAERRALATLTEGERAILVELLRKVAQAHPS